LAKKGIWVSEFRIESGLNCGGHAFATDGYLLGPILEEFKTKRVELSETLHRLYQTALENKGKKTFKQPHPIRITVQGGIGTNEEDAFLRQYYQADSTGWGTPFLLCPEATTVDHETLGLLAAADQSQLVLSKNSPLGIRFHYLKGTSSAKEKLNRIMAGKPGSPCTEKHLATNTEFTSEPICTASHKYQRLKIEQLKALNLPGDEYERQVEEVLAKECLCVGLSNAASINYGKTMVDNLHSVTICPGPNIAYFNKVVTLKEMTDHIYGRVNLLEGVHRPHMFINELTLFTLNCFHFRNLFIEFF
jgi:NAD(P)H-dependent flavin oxidoreductase YrpB (nitropropane dioxygenase family)